MLGTHRASCGKGTLEHVCAVGPEEVLNVAQAY